MADLELKGLSKKFGNVYALKKADLTVADREFVVLVGPSGCGKSTTLMLIAGLEDASEGDIFIDGARVNDVEPKHRDIAMVFQNYALYPHMNVYKNMAFGLKLRGTAKADIHRQVLHAARILEIEDLLHRKPRELSGGQRQRVAMGRAIVRQPKVFLFDEPLSNLDAKLRVQMRAEIKRLHDRLKTTIVYVTHDQVEAMTLADRIVVMKHGLIMDEGPPMEVYKRPRNLFVAGFIGSPAMNFFPGRLSKEDQGLVFRKGEIVLPVPERLRSRYFGSVERDVVLGLRPHLMEDALYAEERPGVERLRATVEVVEPMGNEVVVLLSAGSLQWRAVVDPRTRARVHEPLELAVDMNEMHLFDAGSEELIV